MTTLIQPSFNLEEQRVVLPSATWHLGYSYCFDSNLDGILNGELSELDITRSRPK